MLRRKLYAQLLTADQLRGLLQEAGCVIHPSGVERDLSQMRSTYFLARQIRSRYTILDLAAEVGLLESCVDELFTPVGFWAKNAA